MKQILTLAGIMLAVLSCTMNNPLLTESTLPYGAPPFDQIRKEHYKPAFEQALAEAKAEIDAITANPDAPTFANTLEALENAGQTLERVGGIFYNLLEADTDEQMQQIAEDLSPKMTEYQMYVSLNEALFARIKAVYDQRDALGLDPDQYKLLEDSYKGFTRSGALLSPEDKATYSKYMEELSSKRKTMVATGDRSEKVRTYNYPQSRVTDHRIGWSMHNLPAFMDGDIEECIEALQLAENAEKLKASVG